MTMNTPDTATPATGHPAVQNLLQTESLDALKAQTIEAVRQRPSDPSERWLLFQLLCIDGDWERALRQLQTWATLEPEGTARAQLHRGLIESEMFRTEVFAGTRTPGFVDEAMPAWIDQLLQANVRLGAGDVAGADALREAALDAAPASRGESAEMGDFAWLTDSDTRLGPVCEMAVAGGYRWIPFARIKSVTLTPIGTLTDLVWRPATLILRDATVLRGYVPTRYPGSEHGPAAVRLARETRWQDIGETNVIALGQKTWTTNRGDWGLLDIGGCRFTDEDADGTSS
ncbi:type VI secretion system accessory protein TagJ [Burkholderia latens]|uniref:ImpE protein superfamily protein n=1 Tax=Burkholderia latens TaxID=488446 RepID=A0A6H9TF65_9BURK|nr:type VI secretion system accessory protein TagJ [Burkholderia latens]KAB0642370.1 ImpE protein superfamily protein [Burkholderia latens]VWB76501.1 ImpE protein superfamily protein [Burkholderia latens]